MRTGARRLPIDVLAGADPERTRPPTSILMLRPLVILVLTVERRAARCETCSDTQERCKVRSSERAAGARGVANSYGECIASTRAYRIACSGRACSDQHCRRCSLSRGSYFAALFTPPIGRVALHYRLGMMQRTHGAHLRTVLRYCSRVLVSVSVRVMRGSIELCCRGSTGFSTAV